MCPICWATALASFGMLAIASVTIVIGTDKWMLLLTALLGVVSLVNRLEPLTISWWCPGVIIAAAISRAAYLVTLKKDGLLICTAWRQARQIAARCCPTRTLLP
jgi:hypothetical protein